MAPHSDEHFGRVEAAWSALLGVDRLLPLQVVVCAPAPFVPAWLHLNRAHRTAGHDHGRDP